MEIADTLVDLNIPASSADNLFISKEAYVSASFAALEKERLWPFVWQVACRLEQVAKPGSFYTYDILDESISIVRVSETEIKAYNNACRHRGRRLTEGAGRRRNFICPFHGWKWSLDGKCTEIVDEKDWNGELCRDDVPLVAYKVDTWGGYVFVNMDPAAAPLQEYLYPTAERLDCMEFDKMRIRWHVVVELQANWKGALEAFEEAYHVVQTHKTFAPVFDDRSVSYARGKHGQLGFPMDFSEYLPGHRYGGTKEDNRRLAFEYVRINREDFGGIYTTRDVEASRRVFDELPAGVSFAEAFGKVNELMMQAGLESGAGFPAMTMQQAADAGADWFFFPNMVMVYSPTGSLVFRTRPSPDNNPHKCLWECWAIERKAPSEEAVVEGGYYTNWKDVPNLPKLLAEDMDNIEGVHRGLRTSGLTGVILNPRQERPLINMHRVLNEYIGTERIAPVRDQLGKA